LEPSTAWAEDATPFCLAVNESAQTPPSNRATPEVFLSCSLQLHFFSLVARHVILSALDFSSMDVPDADQAGTADRFRTYWQASTDDSNLTLHGFRRFKTTHLLNLRFLEGAIADLDHKIYQAGLSLNLEVSPTDRLGLAHSKRDSDFAGIKDIITEELVVNLRDLLKQYGA